MTEEMKKTMASLRAKAAKLNKATDQAADLIRKTDAALAALSIGVKAEVEFDERRSTFVVEHYNRDDEERVRVTRRYLAYGRFGGSYCIHVTESVFDSGDNWLADEDSVAWTTLPREDKLRSFEMLPDLLERIDRNSTALVEASESAESTVNQVLEAITDSEADEIAIAGRKPLPPIKLGGLSRKDALARAPKAEEEQIEANAKAEADAVAEATEEGRQAGRHWAEKSAGVRELKRLDKARGQHNRTWDFAFLDDTAASSAYSAAERFAFVVLGPSHDGDRADASNFWEFVLGDDHAAMTAEEGFVQGFAEGALEVFDAR